jgi:phosphoglycerol transferase MdoB-like AlkP superfamily enzyme
MKLMMERFEEAGVLENTVFVIVGDHYPYGLEDNEYADLRGIAGFETFYDIFRSGCIIYKPGMEPQTVSTLASHLDLLPTLCNLFGLPYDSRLYMGRDIFSDSMPLVMFNNQSWLTDYVAYNASSKKYTYFVDKELLPEGFTDYIKADVANRFTISRQILDKDYWSYIFPKE